MEKENFSLHGTYAKTLWRDESDGYTLFSLIVSENVKERDHYNTIIVSAQIPLYIENTPLYVEGNFEKTERGIRFKADVVRESTWDEMSAVLYIQSVFSGTSHKKAEQLVKILGNDIFEGACDPLMPNMIAKKILTVSLTDAQVICETIKNTRIQRELFEFVLKYNGTWSTVMKLMKDYGTKAKEQLIKTPYIGIKYGMSFEQCDRMSADFGGDATSNDRLIAASESVMTSICNSGNVYVSHQKLLEQTNKLLLKSDFKGSENLSSGLITKNIENSEKLMVIENYITNNVYFKYLYKAEINIAKQLVRLIKHGIPFEEYSDNLVYYAENECGMSYAPAQKDAFKLLKQSGVAIVTGGPGTGKTTTVNGLIKGYQKMYPDNVVKLCAPTGRAAQRMTESTGMEAVTIHRILEYCPYGNNVSYKNAEDPIDADLIVVDEASMLDSEIASIFLSAIKDGALVLFLGDINQLPSVGPGDVLHDFIYSGLVPTCRLTTVYRQSGESPIVHNANVVNDAIDNTWKEDLMLNDEFVIKYEDNAEEVAKETIDLLVKLYDKSDPFKTQILLPTHKGDAGVAQINKMAQKILNPHVHGEPQFVYGNRDFRVNDKIIMLSNNYEKGYYNGDIGTVKEIVANGIVVQILDKEIEISRDLMDDVNLAYAMTIHKSQGSEFPNVIVSLPYKPTSMLKRNLFYTAITRAKKTVTVIVEGAALDKSVETTETGKRKTTLIQRIKEEFSK